MIQSPVTLLRRLPRAVQLLVVGTFINRLGSFVLPFLTLVLHREFKLSETRSGWLVGAYGGGAIVSMLRICTGLVWVRSTIRLPSGFWRR